MSVVGGIVMCLIKRMVVCCVDSGVARLKIVQVAVVVAVVESFGRG
jgi:hypothetical protein